MTMITLASQSAIRRKLLEAAGLKVNARRPLLDEALAKQEITAAEPSISPSGMAQALAARKALSLPAKGLVLGADQVLSLGSQRFDKPASSAEARLHLQQLRGKTHHLETAIACALDGQIIWSYLARPALTMRPFTDQFLDNYLDALGDEVKESVGGYKLEGLGVQLFDKIEGDYFSILGVPLLELLAFLRKHGGLQ